MQKDCRCLFLDCACCHPLTAGRRHEGASPLLTLWIFIFGKTDSEFLTASLGNMYKSSTPVYLHGMHFYMILSGEESS